MAIGRILIVYYSYTQQTRMLVKKFGEGAVDQGMEVVYHRLVPIAPYEVPFRSNVRLATAMVQTFCRRRMAIEPLPDICYDEWDLIVLAGPTWSYQPSGPLLFFLDHYGRRLCADRKVLPFISCRTYWRLNFMTIKRRLQGYGAEVLAPVIFTHPTPEPYRLIGLILKLRGKLVHWQRPWFKRHYPHYGHSKAQITEAYRQGAMTAEEFTATDR